jgi:putative methionine-R-sulfoxide reductase with GAF domain/methyl-accepting chemotaxis protein
MRNINISTFLSIGLLFLFIILLVLGIRELRIINKHKQINKHEKELFLNQSLLNENLMILKTEKFILNNIVATKNFSEFELIKTEHQTYQKQFRLNIKKLNKNEFTSTELKESYKSKATVYENEFTDRFAALTEHKENLLNFEAYYMENNSSTDQNKEQIKKSIQDDLLDLKLRSENVLDQLIEDFSVLLQKNTGLIGETEKQADKTYAQSRYITFFVFIPFMILISFLLFRVVQILLIKPIDDIQSHLDVLTKGELPEELILNAGKEISEIAISINKLSAGLKQIADFSLEIGKGNFSTNYNPLGEDDVLGNSLLTLRDNLQSAQEEEEKRKTEDAQRNRTNEALTLFSGILSRQSGDLSSLADEIISSLVKFTDSNQGALFFLNEDDPLDVYYELIGAYAYNRKKYLNKRIKPGEGLVGAVALEKYSVYMTDVPDEYIEIESGTGSANPRSVLIVPLKIEGNVLGVIELASFNIYEEYEIAMVERIAENIASSLANARINMQTAKLLEQSKDQEKLVVEQEEELIKNIQEIKELKKQIYELKNEKETSEK